MNKYLLPIHSANTVLIETVSANNLNDAKDKFIESLGVDNWDKFLKECADHRLFVGNIYYFKES